MFEKVKRICEKEGVKITISSKVVPERMELLWYGGDIVCLEYNGKQCFISAIGDVCFNIRNKNGCGYMCTYKNTNNSGVASNDELFNVISTDEEMEGYIAVGLADWINNNWIEFSICDGEKKLYHETDTDVSNLKDVFDDIGYYIEKLKSFA